MRETFILQDLINSLIVLERTGHNFYTKLANEINDNKIKVLFESLARDEIDHENFFESLKVEFSNSIEIDDDYEDYLKVLISNNFNLEDKLNIDVENYDVAINLAAQLEKDAILFLTEMSKIIGESKREVIEKLINEERKHLKKILSIKSK